MVGIYIKDIPSQVDHFDRNLFLQSTVALLGSLRSEIKELNGPQRLNSVLQPIDTLWKWQDIVEASAAAAHALPVRSMNRRLHSLSTTLSILCKYFAQCGIRNSVS